MNRCSRFVGCLALSAVARISAAQPVYQQDVVQALTLDARLGALIPTQTMASLNLKRGFIAGGTVALQIRKRTHLYLGVDWAHVAPKHATSNGESFDETGYTLGVRFEQPVRDSSGPVLRLEAGGTLKHIETEDRDGQFIWNSGHGLGFEFGTAFLIPARGGLRMVPALRYRSITRRIGYENASRRGALRYLAFELGVSARGWF